jgi:hypothetical protein
MAARLEERRERLDAREAERDRSAIVERIRSVFSVR